MIARKFTLENWRSGRINMNTSSPWTLEIKNCDKIILHHKSLEFDFELSKDTIDKFDTIVVNGIKFRREVLSNNEQLD